MHIKVERLYLVENVYTIQSVCFGSNVLHCNELESFVFWLSFCGSKWPLAYYQLSKFAVQLHASCFKHADMTIHGKFFCSNLEVLFWILFICYMISIVFILAFLESMDSSWISRPWYYR
jgi:hypothetical protein